MGTVSITAGEQGADGCTSNLNLLAVMSGNDCYDKEELVDQVCLVLPVASDKTDDARQFMADLENVRQHNYSASERRIGISKEVWFLAPLSEGGELVGYMESDDFTHALAQFVQSEHEFDLWFKRRLADCTGVDLNTAPSGPMPELLSSYGA